LKLRPVRKCNFCGGEAATPYLEGELGRWCGEMLRLAQCDECGLVRTTPRPLSGELYLQELEGDLATIEPLKRQFSRPEVRENHRKAVQKVMAAAKRPVRSLLDMGCGAGTLMMAAAHMGIEAHGNDVNKLAIDMLTELGFNAYHGFTQNLDFDGRKFDAVMMLNYIGRSFLPFDDLKLCGELLNDGGVVYIMTPYLNSPQHKLQGAKWNVFGNDNVHYFSYETLAAMVTMAGLKIVDDVRSGWLTFIAVKQ
jgi:2-polyprenyl-3-methyl-5-hydroxy-6-metoxy-1,4-benzoquinol methylase